LIAMCVLLWLHHRRLLASALDLHQDDRAGMISGPL
jgi:hypothetical protein